MGNFEKLVVLTVLFLAVIILGVSLHQAGETELANGPLGEGDTGRTAMLDPTPAESGAAERTANERPANNAALSSLTQPKTEQPEGPKERPDFSTMTDTPAPKVAEQPAASTGPRGLLKSTAGLAEPMFGDEYMVYTWKSGDTLTGVAERYYGDRTRRALIQISNEGASYRPGDAINLPVRDLMAGAGTREAFEAVPAHQPPAAQPVEAEAVVTYTVKEGDSLWAIAKQAYGKGTQWESIYKANRDVMKNENDLRAGMVLRLP